MDRSIVPNPDNSSGKWDIRTIRQKSLGKIAKGIAGSGLSDYVQDLQADCSETHSGSNWIVQTDQKKHGILL